MRVVVVGAGAIGSPLAQGLRLAWPEAEITVVDSDVVERSNLPRQPWFSLQDLGRPKALVLAESLGHERVHPCLERVDEHFAWPPADLVMDGTDNWAARQLIQKFARAQGIPWVFAGAVRWEGQVAWMDSKGPCLACLFGSDPPEGLRCFETGVMGMVTLGVAGQALALAQEWVLRPASAKLRRLYLLEGRQGRSWSVGLPKRGCPHFHG